MTETAASLPPGYRLEHYSIDSVLSQGGFSIVYRAHDTRDGRKVVIKEYLPVKYAGRGADLQVIPLSPAHRDLLAEGRKLFFQEASTLTNLVHPNIVRITQFFRENDTAYMVMDYKPGKNLQHYINKRSGGLSEQFLLTVFPPLLDGLALVHEYGLMHLDIKPGNIHIQPGGLPLLLDFGAVLRVQTGRRFQPKQVVTTGFSPPEQHDDSGYVGPWTDLYAIGATMRACILGKAPPSSLERRERDTLKPLARALTFSRRYSPALLEAIDWAMEIDPMLRPQSVAEFRARLDAVVEGKSGENGGVLQRLIGSLWARRSGNGGAA